MRKTVPWTIAIIGLWFCCRADALRASDSMPMLAPEEFAVMPWGDTPGDREVLATIRECGFNLAGFMAPENVRLAGEAGLKCIIKDASCRVGDAEANLDEQEITARVEALVKRTGGNRDVFGYYLCDEPGAGLYPGLGKWAASFRRADPGAIPYINLFPNYASTAQMNVPTYMEYLESYIATVRPGFISYDHYALMDDGSVRDGYFQNLEDVRTSAQRHNLPFWNIVLSNAHFNYAEPSEAGLNFQLYSTLAYGGRGISYFTYFTPAVGNYRLAPIDPFGNKTRTWDMIRSVNLQVHRIGPVYIKLTSVNVFHHPDVPKGCSGLNTSRHITEIEGGSLLVGEFEGPEGQPFLIVVNKSLRRSTAFDLRFINAGQIEAVNSYTGRTEPWTGEHKWLAPGQGMLLCLKK